MTPESEYWRVGAMAVTNTKCWRENPRLAASPRAGGRQEPLMILNCEEADDQTAQGWQAWRAFDDVKGGEFSPELVHGARVRELKYLMDRKVYEYSTCAEVSRRTGKLPSRLKWIDSNKGDSLRPNI